MVPDVEDHDFAMLSAFSGPDLRPTARYWNVDSTGTLRFAELLADSTMNNFSNRHGDYFGIQSDPADRNRIWMIGQYMKNSLFSGNTAIASVRFEDVPPPSDPPPIPDGKDVLRQPLTVAKGAGGDVTVSWDSLACPPAGTHLV